MRKPSWDMKEERADEADNPGPTDDLPQDPGKKGEHNKRSHHSEDSEGDRKIDKGKSERPPVTNSLKNLGENTKENPEMTRRTRPKISRR